MAALFPIGILLILLLLSPVRATLTVSDNVQLFIRLVFFGIVLSGSGHTNRKKRSARRRRARTGKRALLLAVRRTLPRLLRRASLRVRVVGDTRRLVHAPARLGLWYALLGAMAPLLTPFVEQLDTEPLAVGGVGGVELALTLPVGALVGSIGSFLLHYIKEGRETVAI